MSQSTETQVRAAFVGLDELQSTVTVEDILHAAGPVRPVAETLPQHRARSWSLRPVWVGLAAAALVAVLIAVPLLIGRTGSDTPPATEAPEVSTTVGQVPSTTIESSPSTTSAEAVPGDTPAMMWAFDVDLEVDSARPDGPGFVSVPVVGNGQFLVLDSSLEHDWSTRESSDQDGSLDTVLWTSADGLTWQRHMLDALDGSYTWMGGGAHGVTVITRWPGEVLISADLETWTAWSDIHPEVPISSVTSVVSTEQGALLSTGTGRLVAVDPTFTAASLVEGPQGGFLRLLGATDNDYFAYTQDSSLNLERFWTSPDGAAWTELAVPELPEGSKDIVLYANSTHVLLYDKYSGRTWFGDADGVKVTDYYLSYQSMAFGGATEDGFVLGYAKGSLSDPDAFGAAINHGRCSSSRDGTDWQELPDCGLTRDQTQALGSVLLMPAGRVEQLEDNGFTFVASGLWNRGLWSP